MPRFINLVGKRFSKLTVIQQSNNNESNKTTWLCRCDCGNEKTICGGDLKNRRTKSCGCLRITHGLSNHNLYPIWMQMIQRCANIKDKYYNIYGGRGSGFVRNGKNSRIFLKIWEVGGNPDYKLIE